MSIAQQLFEGGNGRAIRQSITHPFGRVKFNLFFNKPEVTRRFNKKEIRVLSGTGSHTRGVMRRMIKKGPKKSNTLPGSPPKYRKRGFASLKDGIFFQADLRTSSVITGANKLKTRTRSSKASGAQLLEEGGSATVRTFRPRKRSFRVPITAKSGRTQRRKVSISEEGKWKTRRAEYRAFPFVAPSAPHAYKRFRELTERINP